MIEFEPLELVIESTVDRCGLALVFPFRLTHDSLLILVEVIVPLPLLTLLSDFLLSSIHIQILGLSFLRLGSLDLDLAAFFETLDVYYEAHPSHQLMQAKEHREQDQVFYSGQGFVIGDVVKEIVRRNYETLFVGV